MKFFYVKHKITGEIVMAYDDQGEEYSWKCMCLSSWDQEQPWLTHESDVDRLLNGEYNDHYAYELSTEMKKAIKNMQLVKCEVEL